MKHGFVKVAAVTPKIKVADPAYNTEKIKEKIVSASERKAKIIVFPELCITGYTCHDLFLQDILLRTAKEKLAELVVFSKDFESLIFVGLPMEKDGKLYNVAAVLQKGQLLGLVPKTHIPTYAEYYEGRHFVCADNSISSIFFEGKEVPFGTIYYLK